MKNPVMRLMSTIAFLELNRQTEPFDDVTNKK